MGAGGTSPDIATVFCEDAREWDDYLTDCFRQQLAPKTLNIVHEKLEDLPLPLPPATAKNFTQAKVVLVIISPDFLDTVERRGPELFDLGRLLEPGHTVAMLCGVAHEEVALSHRAAFPSYSSWPLLVAKNQDKDFVLSVVDETCSLLKKVEEEQEEARRNAAAMKTQQFRLSPRKVQEGSTKIFVMLNQALQQNQKFEVLLESGGMKDVPVKWRNPYVLQFVVPDSFLQTSKIINVHVRCDGSLLGVRQLKCESKLSELHNLLQTAVSPYEMLCLTTGLATLHEVDVALTKSFQLNIPNEGFAFLKPQQLLSERKRSDELLPTLLHFAAYYGLQELASTLLQCPGALHCCFLLNCKGQSPAALATGAGHRDIASMLNDFQKVASATSTDKLTTQDNGTLRTASQPKNTSPKSSPKSPPASIHYANEGMDTYDIPNIPRAAPISNPSYGMTESLKGFEPLPEEQREGTEDEYLVMMPFCTPPQQGQKDSAEKAQPSAKCPVDLPSSTPLEDKMQDILNMEFSNTQEDLIKIIEMYKKGVPFAQVEKMFDAWKKNFDASKSLEENEPVREKHKQRGSSGRQFFNFSDIRQMLTGKSPRRGSNISVSGMTNLVNEDSSEGDAFRRVSTLSAASTSSSGSNASSSSSDRLSTMSSVSAYDSGTHSDTCDDIGRAPVPPPRPPRFPGEKQSDPRTHQYYKFPPVEGAGLHKADECIAQTHSKSKLGKPSSEGADYLVADMQSLMRSLKQTNHASTPSEATIRTCRGSEDIYYDIPLMPRPVVNRHDPLLDYDFPAAALRRVVQQNNKQHSDNGQHYYDIPKFSYPPASTREARLSIPDVPAPPVPVDD